VRKIRNGKLFIIVTATTAIRGVLRGLPTIRVITRRG
jgi:hypothetical protein